MPRPQHPGYDDAEPDPAVEGLLAGYRAVADLFVYPESVDRAELIERCRSEVVPVLRRETGAETADRLEAFLEEYEHLDADEYVQAHELDPACPLYLGHYEFDEPETCRDISDADRNQYMVELNAIYEHFGFELADELPDFVPAMVEFCWLTMPDRDDGLRAEFIEKFARLLPGMCERFESVGTPYRRLLAVLERLLEADLARFDARTRESNADGESEPPDGDGPAAAKIHDPVDGPLAGGETR